MKGQKYEFTELFRNLQLMQFLQRQVWILLAWFFRLNRNPWLWSTHLLGSEKNYHFNFRQFKIFYGELCHRLISEMGLKIFFVVIIQYKNSCNLKTSKMDPDSGSDIDPQQKVRNFVLINILWYSQRKICNFWCENSNIYTEFSSTLSFVPKNADFPSCLYKQVKH